MARGSPRLLRQAVVRVGFDHVHDIVAELFLEEFAVIVNLVFAIAQLHDMLDVLQLFLGKIFLKMELAVDGARQPIIFKYDFAMPATKTSQRFYLHFTWILL